MRHGWPGSPRASNMPQPAREFVIVDIQLINSRLPARQLNIGYAVEMRQRRGWAARLFQIW